MAYQAPDSVVVGDPVKKTTYDKLKNNTSEHETRIAALETGSSTIVIMDENFFNLIQYVDYPASLEGLIHFQAKQDMTLTSAIVTDLQGSTSGAMEVDVLVSSTVGGTYTTVFSVQPSVTSATPAESSNGVFSTTSISTGQWIRLDITSIAVGGRSINFALTAVSA